MRPISYRWVVVVLWCALVVPAAGANTRFAGQVIDPPLPPMDFTLQASNGAEFRLSQQRGKVVLLSFGYTFCPDVCPTTLVELSQVRVRLKEAAKHVQVVFITLDPERDTPDRLEIYAKAFDPTFIGLTGSVEQLARARMLHGVEAEKQVVPGTTAPYLIAHTAYTYVIDRQGQLRLQFPFGMSVEEMADDVLQLLRR